MWGVPLPLNDWLSSPCNDWVRECFKLELQSAQPCRRQRYTSLLDAESRFGRTMWGYLALGNSSSWTSPPLSCTDPAGPAFSANHTSLKRRERITLKMKVLITGGSGFIDSLSQTDWSTGDEVLALDNYATGRRDNLVIRDGLSAAEGSIADSDFVDAQFDHSSPTWSSPLRLQGSSRLGRGLHHQRGWHRCGRQGVHAPRRRPFHLFPDRPLLRPPPRYSANHDRPRASPVGQQPPFRRPAARHTSR